MFGVLGGPIVALANQVLIYGANMWACGHGIRSVMHIVPAVCLAVTLVAAMMSYRSWTGVGGGAEDEAATIATRTRFLAILGIAISVFSSLVILAQWTAILVFEPCMRA